MEAGEPVGVSRAAAVMREGVYRQGLSSLCHHHGVAVVQDAVEVFVTTFRSFVHTRRVRVTVFVLVVKTACGVMDLVFFAVADGLVTVRLFETVDMTDKVEVIIEVITGVEVILKVTVGVYVVVCWGSTVRKRSLKELELCSELSKHTLPLCQANGCPSLLFPIARIILCPETISLFLNGHVESIGV